MLEIERKFLIHKDLWQPRDAGDFIAQGYLCAEPGHTVRVRVRGDKGYLTVKGKNDGIIRAEYEYPIPAEEAKEMLQLCPQPVLSKVRHTEMWHGFAWEIDVFDGDNAPLILAEIELPSPDTEFSAPPWLGQEVSDDKRYFNSYLAAHPYNTWGEQSKNI